MEHWHYSGVRNSLGEEGVRDIGGYEGLVSACMAYKKSGGNRGGGMMCERVLLTND